MTKAQQVRRIRRMRDAGATWANIASALGVCEKTARRVGAGNRCVDCQVFITGDSRCHACANLANPLHRAGTAKWTKQMIRQAIVSFYVHKGRPPTATEWNREGNTHPSAMQIRSVYGNFSDGIRDAGITPRRPGGAEDRPSHTPAQRKVLEPTVENGFSSEEELAYLIAEQVKDDRYGHIIFNISLDGNDFRTAAGYNDEWTWAVCVIADYRRMLNRVAKAYDHRKRTTIKESARIERSWHGNDGRLLSAAA